jgi:hypothetical protein
VGELTIGVTLKDGTHTFTDNTVSFNHSQFYLTKDSLGNPEVNFKLFPDDAITFKDGTHTFTDNTVSFSFEHFYITPDSSGNPVVNYIESTARKYATIFPTTGTVTDDVALAAITFGEAFVDKGGWFSLGAPTRLTVPSGVSTVQLTGQFAATSGGASPGAASSISCQINLNGVAMRPNIFFRYSAIPAVTTRSSGLFTTPVISVTPGDYFELLAAVVDFNTNPVLNSNSYFAIWMLS